MNLKRKCEEIKIPLNTGYVAACWYGEQNERPIVAMHGWQDNAGSFALLAPLLSQYAAILAIDLPGHGRSSHFSLGTVYHTLDYVRTIREILLHFKWPKITLMGHSMSCTIIYIYTALFPETVDMIISIDALHTRYFSMDQQINILNLSFEKFLIDSLRKVTTCNSDNKPKSYTFSELEQIMHKASETSIDLNKTKYILERNITKSKYNEEKYIFSRDSGIKYILESNTEPEFTEAMAKRIRNIKWLVLKAESSQHINEEHIITQRVLTILKENNPDFCFQPVTGVKHHCHLNNAEKIAEYIIPFILKYRQQEYYSCKEKSKL